MKSFYSTFILFCFLLLIKLPIALGHKQTTFPLSMQQHLKTRLITNKFFPLYFNTQNLRKGQFVCIAKKEINTLLDKKNVFYKTNSAVKPQYTVNISSWVNLIQSLTPKTPLVQHILSEILENKAQLKTVQDIEALFFSILTTCNNRSWLRKHYDTHRMIYRQKTSLYEIATKEEIFKYDIRNDFTIFVKTLSVHLSNTIDDTQYTPDQK